MDGKEFPSNNGEVASDQELREVFDKAEQFMRSYMGTEYEMTVSPFGHQDNLPIVHDPPRLTTVFSADYIRTIAPNAATTLNIQEDVETSYASACYLYGGEGKPHSYSPPAFALTISQPQGSALEYDGYIVESREGGSAVATRLRELAREELADTDISDIRIAHAIDPDFEDASQTISRREYEALQEILDGLLRNYQIESE